MSRWIGTIATYLVGLFARHDSADPWTQPNMTNGVCQLSYIFPLLFISLLALVVVYCWLLCI